jgi:hypothetical protein
MQVPLAPVILRVLEKESCCFLSCCLMELLQEAWRFHKSSHAQCSCAWLLVTGLVILACCGMLMLVVAELEQHAPCRSLMLRCMNDGECKFERCRRQPRPCGLGLKLVHMRRLLLRKSCRQRHAC